MRISEAESIVMEAFWRREGAQSAEGPSSTAYPWNRNASAVRVQYIYDSTIFTNQGVTTPIRITGARWRANAAAATTTWAGTTYNNATVALSTSHCR